MHIDDPQATIRKSLADLRFWRPHFPAAGASAEHLPTLVWLATMLRPRNVVYLGVGQGAGYFALCQALNDAERSARLTGVDTWPEAAADGALPDIPEALKAHNLANYAEQSRLFLSDASSAVELIDGADIDLLVVGQELTPEVVGALRRHWLGAMSPRGVVVLLDRRSAVRHVEAEEGLIELGGSMPSVDLPVTPGITLLFPGTEPSPLLSALNIQGNDPGSAALLRDHLALLGATLAAVTESERFRSELALQRIENQAFRQTLGTHDDASRQLLSQVERLTTTVEALTISRDRTMSEQAGRIAELSASETRLRHALAEQEEAHSAARRALDRQEEALHGLQEELGTARAHVDQMYASTSWRLTAPIRVIKRAFSRGG